MNQSLNHSYGTLTAPDTVRIERLLPGPIERVWAYLTESDKRCQWLAAGAMDLRPGGSVELIFDNDRLVENDDPPPPKYAGDANACHSAQRGRITELDPPRLLGYTWNEGGGAPSQVTFELSEQGAQVHLRITHRLLRDRDEIVSVSGGWHAHVDILIARLTGRTPDGFWRSHTRLEAEYEQRIG